LANGTENGNGHRAHFWMKVASWTFGLWAIGVPLTAAFIVDAVNTVKDEQRQLDKEFDDWTRKMESRHALIDERQSLLMRKMDMIENDHHQWFYEKMAKPKVGE
jgi:hypothetical protein